MDIFVSKCHTVGPCLVWIYEIAEKVHYRKYILCDMNTPYLSKIKLKVNTTEAEVWKVSLFFL